MSRILLVLILGSIACGEVYGSSVCHQFGEILKTSNGDIDHMTYEQAMKACPIGSHLPTAREITQLAVNEGAEGILTQAQVDRERALGVPFGDLAQGVSQIVALNPGQFEPDRFWFRFAGYKVPTGDLVYEWFWSSSLDPRGYGWPFYFQNHSGVIAVAFPNYKMAVRCISDR
jgi:hypothetical protein